MPTTYTEWLKSQPYAKGISPLGESVAELLGTIYRGLYHLPETSLKKVDWKNKDLVSIVIRGGLSSFDDSDLTVLVVLAHDRMIRVTVEGAANNYLRILFSPRKQRWEHGITSSMTSMPTMETHLERIRKIHPAPAE